MAEQRIQILGFGNFDFINILYIVYWSLMCVFKYMAADDIIQINRLLEARFCKKKKSSEN